MADRPTAHDSFADDMPARPAGHPAAFDEGHRKGISPYVTSSRLHARKPKRPEPELIRGVGVAGATTLNMIDMIGVGPFITMPLIIAAMGGPQAMLGWILGAVLVMCDGLVWAELGASMPHSGGPYNYLKEIYGPQKLGRLMSFLFIWQLTFSAPLSIASGGIGFAQYATYIFPSMGNATKIYRSRSSARWRSIPFLSLSPRSAYCCSPCFCFTDE